MREFSGFFWMILSEFVYMLNRPPLANPISVKLAVSTIFMPLSVGVAIETVVILLVY